MKLNYTPQAFADLHGIHQYIAKDDARAADQVIARILQSLSILESHPFVGRTGRIEDTREWSIYGLPYIAIDTIPDDIHVDVIAIVHTSKNIHRNNAPRYCPTASESFANRGAARSTRELFSKAKAQGRSSGSRSRIVGMSVMTRPAD